MRFAAEQKPQLPYTLGLAHYSNSDWKVAIEALTESVRFSQEGDGSDFFFIAIAHWPFELAARLRENQLLSVKAGQAGA
jgi:hypothetical protein